MGNRRNGMDLKRGLFLRCRSKSVVLALSRGTNTKQGMHGTRIPSNIVRDVEILTSAATIRVCIGNKRIIFSSECCPRARRRAIGIRTIRYSKGVCVLGGCIVI